jgi:transposase
MADQSAGVILGVDTHAQVHVACLLDQLGRPLGTLTIPVTTAGFHQLMAWASRHGRLIRAGVEGTGTYGAALPATSPRLGVTVVEVDRPNRQRRRRRGKSDPIDAEVAARAVLADEATTTPKARTQTANQLRDLLVTVGDNPDRLRSDAALAALCGASPVAASSGKTVRHRLNRGGDRQANSALWVIALTRLRIDPASRAYAKRRTAQGKTTKEIMRLLKRYLARELFPLLKADLHHAHQLNKT